VTSPVAVELAAQLRTTTERFIAVVERIGPERWAASRGERWSLGKEAEHVAEAMAGFGWGVRLSVGEEVGPPPPNLERKALTARGPAEEVVEALRLTVESCARLVEGLSDEQLALAARPTRTRTIGQAIERVLIGHVERHRREIERALRRK
jgi:DinB superfamily